MRMPPSIWILVLIWLVGNPLTSSAAEPDFLLIFSECSTTLGSSQQLDFPLKTIAGEPARLACSRQGRKATCALTFKNKEESIRGGNVHEYDIEMETGNKLDLTLAPNGGDYIAIDRSAHAAI